MKDFNTIDRYDPTEVLTDRWERADMDKEVNGDYVYYEDYKELLDVYEELKFRMDSLED